MQQMAQLFKYDRVLPSNLEALQIADPPVRQLASYLVANDQAHTDDFAEFINSRTFPAVQHMPAMAHTVIRNAALEPHCKYSRSNSMPVASPSHTTLTFDMHSV